MTDTELRELEWQVAERVFGMNRLEARVDPMNRNGEPQYFWGYPLGHDFAPEYARDITAAFEVVEKMRKRGYEVEVTNSLISSGWGVFFRDGNPLHTVSAGGPSLPDCICRAALQVAEQKD